jgi:hypothetical protein
MLANLLTRFPQSPDAEKIANDGFAAAGLES